MSDNGWNPPGAPDLTGDFNKAAESTMEHSDHSEQARTPDIATVYEQNALEEQRAELVAEQHYTIEGTVEHVVNQQLLEELEQRINSIRERREAASERFRNDFRNSTRRR